MPTPELEVLCLVVQAFGARTVSLGLGHFHLVAN